MAYFSISDEQLTAGYEAAVAAGEKTFTVTIGSPTADKRGKVRRVPDVWAKVLNPSEYRRWEDNSKRPNALLEFKTEAVGAWLAEQQRKDEYENRARRYMTEAEAEALLLKSGAVRIVSPDDQTLRGWLYLSNVKAWHEGDKDTPTLRYVVTWLLSYNGAMMTLPDGTEAPEHGKHQWVSDEDRRAEWRKRYGPDDDDDSEAEDD